MSFGLVASFLPGDVPQADDHADHHIAVAAAGDGAGGSVARGRRGAWPSGSKALVVPLASGCPA